MAVEPTINITQTKVWVVANGVDNDQIAVTVFNGTLPMNGSVVTFSVDDTDLGFFNPISPTIVGQSAPILTVNGSATVFFMTKTKSGNATISANVRYKMNDTAPEENKTVLIIQRIDHDTPYKIASYHLTSEGTVGTEDPIFIWVQDSHNNPVDNKREMSEGKAHGESVVYSITGQPEPASPVPESFVAGYFSPEDNSTVTRYVNESGAVNASLILSTIPGSHNVMTTAIFPSEISKKFIIEGQADGEPWYIDCQVFPDASPNPYLPADGMSQFTLIYSMYDKFMNGLQAKNFDIESSKGETFHTGTNGTGQQKFTYGPNSEVALIDITATASDNSSVTITNTIEFVNTTANNMVFTATPQSMQSADVRNPPTEPPKTSTLAAHVLDIEGNAIRDQPVQFTISNVHYDDVNSTAIWDPWLKNQTSTTNLTSVWAVTDNQGLASVTLMPCYFNTNKTDHNSPHAYNPTDTGYCTVNANWISPNGTLVTRSIDFTFKNFPYMSAKTFLSSSKIPVNGTVDVTLALSGDGFALYPTPIDVMLVCDMSGSMHTAPKDMENLQGTPNSWYRWDAENASATAFINKMNSSTDRLGLLLYAADPTTINYHLSKTQYTNIKNALKNTNPSGSTGTRKAIKIAIDDMSLPAYQNSDPSAIRAIILMTDGEFNNYGDPLARGIGYAGGSGQKDPNSHWYTGTSSGIYAWDSPSGDGNINHHTWFTGLGGSVKGAVDANNVTNQNMTLYAKSKNLRVYTISLSGDIVQNGTIWNTLENLAQGTGGKHYHANSTAQLTSIYENIAGELKNKAGVDIDTNLSFENVQVKNVTVQGSEVFNYVYQNGVSTHIEKYDQSGYHDWTYDNRTQWNTTHSLDFNVGTIFIGDYWKATFRLQAIRDGDIHVFDNSSMINFLNAGLPQALPIPDTVLNVVPDATNDTGQAGEFSETEVNVTALTDSAYKWDWKRHYTGDQEVSEFYFISFDGGQQWTLIGDRTLSPGDARNQTLGSFTYDIRSLLPMDLIAAGVTIDFKIKAYASDAPSPRTPRSLPVSIQQIVDQKYITLQ
jgi:hypothetical protein